MAQQEVYGKVYALFTNDLVDEKGDRLLYIGSTRNQYMKKRLNLYRAQYKKYSNIRKWSSSFYIFEITNKPFFIIFEEGEYTSSDALKGQENAWISYYRNRCLNYRNQTEEQNSKEYKGYARQADTEEIEESNQNSKTYSCSICKSNNMTLANFKKHCNTNQHKINGLKTKTAFKAWNRACRQN